MWRLGGECDKIGRRKFGAMHRYICTNEPEVCGFMTNEIKAGKLAIMKCDECRDGYLVIKPGKGDNPYFLGCTNYKQDKTGCGRVISKKYYYDMMKYAPDPEPVKEQQITPQERTVSHTSVESKNETTQQQIFSSAVATENTVSGIDLANVNIASVAKGVLYRNHELSEALSTIIMACVHISNQKFYGVFVLNEVLHGSTADKIIKAKLDKVPEYGMLKWLPINETTFIINWLIDNHYLHQTKGQYPVLHPTSDTGLFAEKITTAQLNKLKTSLERMNL